MSKTIGIDLGTTNSVVAFKDASVRVVATGPNNEDLCRSCVAMDKSGSFVVGNAPYKTGNATHRTSLYLLNVLWARLLQTLRYRK